MGLVIAKSFEKKRKYKTNKSTDKNALRTLSEPI